MANLLKRYIILLVSQTAVEEKKNDANDTRDARVIANHTTTSTSHGP